MFAEEYTDSESGQQSDSSSTHSTYSSPMPRKAHSSTGAAHSDHTDRRATCHGLSSGEDDRTRVANIVPHHHKRSQVESQHSSCSPRPHQLDCLLHELLHYVESTEDDERRVRGVLSDLQDMLRPLRLNIALYGSLCTGIRTPSSDVDCVMIPVDDTRNIAVCEPLGGGTRAGRVTTEYRTSSSCAHDSPLSSSSSMGRWHNEEHDDPRRSRRSSDSHHGRHHDDDALRAGKHHRLNTHHVRHVMEGLQRTLNSSSELKSCYIAALRVVADVMRDSRKCSRVFCITRARIPIIKCVHNTSTVPVDLSFSADGVTTSRFLCHELAKRGNENVRGLTILVKMLLTQAGLNDASVGGLGSFPVTLMMLWYVKHVACDFDHDLRSSLSTMLIGFLKYYSCDFDYGHEGIDYVAGKKFRKPPAAELFLVNPMKPGTNCAKAATLFASKVIPLFYSLMRTLSSLIDESSEHKRVKTKYSDCRRSAASSANDANASSKICATLAQLFDRVVPPCRNWSHLRSVTQKRTRREQNQWCPETNMYRGGTCMTRE